MKQKHPKKQLGQTPLMEELEPRILMSASLEGLLVDDNLNDNNYTQSAEHLVITESEIVAAEADDSIRRELVIVDTDTPDFQLLLDDLLNQQTSERQFDVLLLDNNQNGIDQITAALGNYQNLNAIHIVSDGNNGNIDLGNTTLSYNNIDVYSGDIASWSNALAQDADILIYGCELASGVEGVNLIDSLSVLTGADIAASDDLTGATDLGGDWELEYQNGNIETQLAFSLEVQQSWGNVLAIIDFSGTAYQSDGSTGIDGATITLIVNGANLGSDTTDLNGNYSITASSNVNNNDAVVIFIDNNGTYKSTLVTESDGSTNLTGLNLINNTLTLRSDSGGGGTLTNTDMNDAKGDYIDPNILFDFAGSELTIEGGAQLHVAENQTYAPGDYIEANNMWVEGTFQASLEGLDISGDLLIDGGIFTASSDTTSLSGDFTVSNGGTFDASTGRLILDGSSRTLDAAGVTFYNVTIEMGSSTLTLDSDMDIDGDLLIRSVGSISNNDINISGNVTTNERNVGGDATFVFDGDQDQLLIDDEGGIGSLSSIEVRKSETLGAGTLTISNSIGISGLSGTGFLYTSGIVNASDSTLYLTGSSRTIDSGSVIFNDVVIEIGNSSLNLDSDMDIDGNLTLISVGNVNNNGGNILVSGNVTTRDSGVGGNATFVFDGDQDQLLIDDEGGIGSLSSIEVRKSETLGAGTLTISNSIGISGLSGTGFLYTSGMVNASDSTLYLTGSSKTIDTAGMTFDNVIINIDSSSLTLLSDMDIDGDLTFTSVGSVSGNYNFTVAGDLTSTDSNVSGDAGITLDGSGTQLIGGDGEFTEGNIIIDSSGVVELTSALNLDGTGQNLTIENGTLDLKGFDLDVEGAFTVNADQVLQLQGNEDVLFGSLVLGDRSDVIYNGTNGSYDVKNWAYEDLKLNGDENSIFTLTGDTSIGDDLRINGGTLDLKGFDLTVNDELTVNIDQVLQLQGNEDVSFGSLELETGSDVIYNGTDNMNPYTIKNWDYQDLRINGTGGVFELSVNTTIGDDLRVINGTLDLKGFNLNINDEFTVNANQVLQLQGNETVLFDSLTLGTGSDVIYNGTDNITPYTIKNWDYQDLRINGADGTYQLQNPETISGDLTISAGTLDLNGNNLIVDFNLTVASGASFTLNGDEMVTTGSLTLASGSLVIYDGVSNYNGLLLGNSYSNLSLNNGTWTLDNDLNVDGDITISNNATLDVGANEQINIAGTWNNTANFNAQNGTVLFDGSDQTVLGSTQFFNFTKTDTLDDGSYVSIAFDSTGTQTIDGTLTLQGLDWNDRLNLTSDVPGSQWSLILASTAATSINLVTVRDSNASGSDGTQIPVNAALSLNNGNNTAWAINYRPSSDDNTVTTNEDTPYVVTLSDFNYGDPNSDSLDHIIILGLESVGTLQLNGVDVTLDQTISAADINAGNLTFTPAANDNGSAYDSFRFNVSDGIAYGDHPHNLTFDVNAVNDAPVVLDSTLTIQEDELTLINISDLIANGSDIENDTLTLQAFTQPQNGTLTDNGDGTLTYVSETNYNGEDSFSYTLADGQGASDTATLTITITPVNDAPVVLDSTLTIQEDELTLINISDLIANGSDIENDTLTLQAFTQPQNGTLTDNGDGTLTYVSETNYNGEDSFSYTLADGQGASDTATLTITITPVNDAPVVLDSTLTIQEDEPTIINISDLIVNGSDIENDTLTLQAFTQPQNGTLTDNGDGTLTYAPDTDYNGTDSFSYTLIDDQGESDTATVTITVTPVNDTPVALDSALTLEEDELTLINISDLIASGSDSDNDTLMLLAFTQPENGTLTDNGDGTLTYVPNTDYNGEDSFSYTLADSQGNSVIATMAITVTPVNDIIITEEILQSTLSTNETSETTEALVEEIVETLTQGIEDAATTQETQTEATQEQVTEVNKEEDITQLETVQSNETTTADLSETNSEVAEIGEATEQDQASQQTSSDSSTAYYWGAQPIMTHQVDANLVQLAKINPALAKELNELTRSGTSITFSAPESRYLANVSGNLLSHEYSDHPLYNPDAALWDALDEMATAMNNNDSANPQAAQQELIVSVATGAAWSVSAGIVASSLRSGSLVASLMSSVPLWNWFDPLPVLSISADELVKQQEQYDQEANKENKKYRALDTVFD